MNFLRKSWRSIAVFSGGGASSMLAIFSFRERRRATDVARVAQLDHLTGLGELPVRVSPDGKTVTLGAYSTIRRSAGPMAIERNQLERAIYQGLQKAGGRADQLNLYNQYLGDPGFLPKDIERYQRVTAADAAAQGFGVSLLERLVERYGPSVTRRLRVQYRMHEAIMNFSSREFYDGDLTAEDPLPFHVRTHTAEDVHLDCLEVEKGAQVVERSGARIALGQPVVVLLKGGEPYPRLPLWDDRIEESDDIDPFLQQLRRLGARKSSHRIGRDHRPQKRTQQVAPQHFLRQNLMQPQRQRPFRPYGFGCVAGALHRGRMAGDNHLTGRIEIHRLHHFALRSFGTRSDDFVVGQI